MIITKNSKIEKYDLSDINSKQSKIGVYHYTSPEGLYEILKNSTLRFTDCQFLNDKSEYIHIVEILKTAVKELLEHDVIADSYNITDAISMIEKTAHEYELTVPAFRDNKIIFKDYALNYYIFCASRKSDNLNMWNYYLKNGCYKGYNIKFTVNQLLKCFENDIKEDIELYYSPVIYDDNIKKKIVKEIILDAIKNFETKLQEVEDQEDYSFIKDEVFDYIIKGVEQNRLFFKDKSFSDESEFRFIIKVPSNYEKTKNSSIEKGVFIKNGIFTPYCDVEFNKNTSMSEINIAPIMDSDLAYKGLKRYLHENGYKKRIKISKSNIPVRY